MPADIWRIVIACAAYSFQDIINIGLISKDFRAVLPLVIDNVSERFSEVKALVLQQRINLRDPLYIGFTYLLPFSEKLDPNSFASLRIENYNRILASQSTPPVQLDRLFGYMLENREIPVYGYDA